MTDLLYWNNPKQWLLKRLEFNIISYDIFLEIHISNLKYRWFIVGVQHATTFLNSAGLYFIAGKHLFHFIATNAPKSLWFYLSNCSRKAGDLCGGEEQEAGEGVAGAALGRHDVVVPGCLQWDRVSDLQLQDRRAGGDQETISNVTQRHVNLAALHQFHTHLDERTNTDRSRNYHSNASDYD